MRLLRVEIRRALHRRAVRVLLALGALGCAIAGLVSFLGSAGKSVVQLRADSEGHPALMADWWDQGDGFLAMAMIFLTLGALFGGATVAGGEWRAGTVTSVLTWEPRRHRVHAARTASAMVLAFLFSLILQVLFLASFLPSVWAHGTTDGVDGSFWTGLVMAMIRTSMVTAAAAALAVALATLARNTAFAVVAVFAWVGVIENTIRALTPSLAEWLWMENLATVLSWGQLSDVDFSRTPLVALATLGAYWAALVTAAGVSFQRRDITAAT